MRALPAGLLALILAGGLLLGRFGRSALSIDRMLPAFGQGGPSHAILFVVLQIGVAAFGILPASLIAVAAGVTYGLAEGFALSALGTIIGGAFAFQLSRSVFRPWIAQRIARNPRLASLDAAVAADGWRFVCLLRLSPVMPFAPVSYALGLTRLDFRAFMLGTLAALPALLGYVALGAIGRAGLSFAGSDAGLLRGILLVIGAAGTILFALHLRRLMRRALAGSAGNEHSQGLARPIA